jgi:hypothetical protein
MLRPIGVTWLIKFVSGVGEQNPLCVKNFNLGRGEGGKRLKIGLNQSFIYIHPFPHAHPNFVILPSATQ